MFIRKVTEGLLNIDLNDFKRVNDADGYATGDEVLLTAAHRLRSGLRPQDVVARLGGDEFAVLATSFSANGLAVLAARLGDALAKPHRY